MIKRRRSTKRRICRKCKRSSKRCVYRKSSKRCRKRRRKSTKKKSRRKKKSKSSRRRNRKSSKKKSRRTRNRTKRRRQCGGSEGQVVLFHADWCGYCKKFLPTWKKLKAEFGNRIVDFEQTKNPEIMQKFGIRSYPTIKYVPDLNSTAGVVEMRAHSADARSYDNVAKFIKRHTK